MSSNYSPKNILITGGAGFIASHVVIYLVKKYPHFNIINFDKLDYCSCLENVDSIIGDGKYLNYKFIKGDITFLNQVQHILETEQIDTIMHFAAQTHVDNSFGNSFQFTNNNIFGTHVLLESAKNVNTIKRFIHVSTDEVYGEGKLNEDEMTEEHVLEPTNPYSATKAGAEYLVKSYYKSFNLPIIITRGNNVYGPHQYPEKMIPKFTNQLLRGKKLTLHGDGSNTRNFLHVDDVVTAFDTLLHKGEIGETYNIGGSTELTNLEVAKTIIHLMGLNNMNLISFVADRHFNDLRYTINCNKLKNLGWIEKTKWETGIKETINWYIKYSDRYKNIDDALVAHPRHISINTTNNNTELS